MISALIPVYNEKESVKPLHAELIDALSPLGAFEIIYIDDGSTDGTEQELARLYPAKVVRLLKNSGKTAAISAGLSSSKGSIIVTIDGDGQNDPADIVRLVARLNEGADAVIGRRAKRKDPLGKKIASRGAYGLRRILLGSRLRDSVCGLQAYKRDCLDQTILYGEMHRYLPDILAAQGFEVVEVDANHRPRLHGKSKFTSIRMVRGFLDMISVMFWRRYSSRPLHIFGGIGMSFITLGALIVIAFFILRSLNIPYLAQSIWALVGFFLILAGMQLFVTGLLADIALKNYHRQAGISPYRIKESKVQTSDSASFGSRR
jgi:glycosyltransferase involved in cell wall biosynthesis